MADGPYDQEDRVSSLLELFGGRFDEREVECLLRHNEEDTRQTANYILTTEPTVVRRFLESKLGSWNLVMNLGRLRRDNQPVITNAKKGLIHTSVRLFACGPCDQFWWRRVPKRKMVSTCNGPTCNKQKYRAISRKREWGIAIYNCPRCNNQFRGWGQMELIYSPCFGCGTPVKPSMIIPPTGDNPNKGKSRHQCLAPDCYNRRPGRMWTPPEALAQHVIVTCVHPISRRRNGLPIVVIGSELHQSTGSTVATFLPQDDLLNGNRNTVVFEPELASISET